MFYRRTLEKKSSKSESKNVSYRMIISKYRYTRFLASWARFDIDVAYTYNSNTV